MTHSLAETIDAAGQAARYGVPPAIHAADFIYRDKIDNDPNPDRDAALRHATWSYFWDGDQSATILDTIIRELHPDAVARGVSLLEFAAGYGCVSRHLDRLAGTRLLACDIHDAAIDFLRDDLGVPACGSVADPDRFRLDGRFDAVFALSFFSHMPPTTFARWLRALFACVADHGLLIFTTHGRAGHRTVGEPPIEAAGYRYAPSSEQKDLPTDEYGFMLATPAWVMEQIRPLGSARLIRFEEAFWWKTQDLYVIRKATDLFHPDP